MGFRVMPKTPTVTKDDAAFGFIGLTVVLARRKAIMAGTPNPNPTQTRTRAIDTRALGGS
jgi:hypothetical protein